MSFDLQPTLKGKLLDLRPLSSNDFDDLFRVASDPLIWEVHPVRNRFQPDVFKDFFEKAIDSGGALVVIDSGTRRIIGSSRFFAYDPDACEIEIGYTFLARSHWGGIFNREMKTLMLNHAFRFVRRVVFLVGPANFRSQRAMEKIGAVRSGWRINSAGQNCVLFEITKPL